MLSFLNAQSKDLKTYATNPLWQTVDGPFKLKGYTLTGRVTFVPNKNYSGPNKPKISQFVEVPFTSADAEYNALRAGSLTVGYVPATDYSTIPAISQEGYNTAQWKVYGFNSIFYNFNNPSVGPAFKQLYVRQAMQYLMDQQLQISKVFSGYAQPDYGMVVNGPSSYMQAESNPYPYDPAKAKALLTAHGWDVKPGGTTTCASPGTAANECGAGVKAGAPLNFNLMIYTGQTFQQIAMTSYKTVAATVGIHLNLVDNVNVYAAAPTCTASQSSCSWQLADWGGGVYTPPNGFAPDAGYLACGAANNHENYCDPAQDKLETATSLGGATQTDFNNWERFATEQLPMIYQPNADFEVIAVKKNLAGAIPANPTLGGVPRKLVLHQVTANPNPETLVGYASSWTVRAGGSIEFMVSAGTSSYQAEIIRVTGRGPQPDEQLPPLSFEPVPAEIGGSYPGTVHQTVSGSFGTTDAIDPSESGSGTVYAWIFPTLPELGRWQAIVTWLGDDGQAALALGLTADGRPAVRYRTEASSVLDGELVAKTPAATRQWQFVAASVDPATGRLVLMHQPAGGPAGTPRSALSQPACRSAVAGTSRHYGQSR